MNQKQIIKGVVPWLVAFAATVGILACANQTTPEPEPLVIESSGWTPHGIYEGTIVIDGGSVERISYEGIMYIEMDGARVLISCTEAVRSKFGKRF